MLARAAFLEALYVRRNGDRISSGLGVICEYASARYYLLARYDQFADKQVDSILASNWPFDLARSLGVSLINAQARVSEFQRCLSAFEPAFINSEDDFDVPSDLSRRVCLIPFNAGEARLMLLLLFDEGMFLSHDRLRDVALAASYYAVGFPDFVARSERVAELTKREIECLSWTGEGKTSDEIALIIGISRNTVNNYMTSILNKTGARTRSEAVAFGVRNQII